MSPEAKAKARAANKARHKGTTLQVNSDGEELADTGGDNPAPAADAAPAATPAASDKAKSFNELPSGTRATYDRQGLLRRNALVRLQQNQRKLHHYDLSAPKHTEATRAERKLRKHSRHRKAKDDSAEPRQPKAAATPVPAADPTQPTPAAAPEPAAPKPVKQKQAKLPKPDPTQPGNGQ